MALVGSRGRVGTLTVVYRLRDRVLEIEGEGRFTGNGSEPAPGDFFRTENWQHPTVLTYDEPRLVKAGTVLEFSCTQHNEKPVPLRFGPLFLGAERQPTRHQYPKRDCER